MSFIKPSKAAELIEESTDSKFRVARKMVVISTWKHGMEANAEAWKEIESNGEALDAVEKGVMVTEADLTNRSVGVGNPVKLVKEVSDKMLGWKTEGTELYQKLAASSHENLKEVEPLREIPKDRRSIFVLKEI